jgi:hypothetical protein
MSLTRRLVRRKSPRRRPRAQVAALRRKSGRGSCACRHRLKLPLLLLCYPQTQSGDSKSRLPPDWMNSLWHLLLVPAICCDGAPTTSQFSFHSFCDHRITVP